jgi:hypothetical protein
MNLANASDQAMTARPPHALPAFKSDESRERYAAAYDAA